MSEAGPGQEAQRAAPSGSWLMRLRRHPPLRHFLLRFVPLHRRNRPYVLGLRMNRSETGLLGEFLAAKYLREHGRRILYRNYRGLHRGEVDIVARHGQTLTFVEVKTRRSSAYGRPADAVTEDKQRLIIRGAQDWLRLLGNPRITLRFDIAEVLLIDGETPKINIIENAFTLPASSMTGR